MHDPDFIPSGEFDSLRLSPRPGEDRSPSPRSPSPFQPLRSPSPQEIHPDTASISSCPEMVGHMVKRRRKMKSWMEAWERINLMRRCFDHKLKQNCFYFYFQGRKDREKTSLKGLLYKWLRTPRGNHTVDMKLSFYYGTKLFLQLCLLCKVGCSSFSKKYSVNYYKTGLSKTLYAVSSSYVPDLCILVYKRKIPNPRKAPEAVFHALMRVLGWNTKL